MNRTTNVLRRREATRLRQERMQSQEQMVRPGDCVWVIQAMGPEDQPYLHQEGFILDIRRNDPRSHLVIFSNGHFHPPRRFAGRQLTLSQFGLAKRVRDTQSLGSP